MKTGSEGAREQGCGVGGVSGVSGVGGVRKAVTKSCGRYRASGGGGRELLLKRAPSVVNQKFVNECLLPKCRSFDSICRENAANCAQDDGCNYEANL